MGYSNQTKKFLDFIKKIIIFINSKYFFIFILFIYLSFYVFLNFHDDLESISSDIWLNQAIMIQEKGDIWSHFPPAYSRNDFYWAFPILYYLNPGLEHGLIGYHFLAILIIVLIYTVSGLVIKKVFNSWLLASLGALLCVIPRNILPTTMGVLGMGDIRGNRFAFPFYLLLSYYWIIYGLKDKWKNILLAIAAGLLVYLYPPAGLVIVFLFFLTAFFIRGRRYWKQLAIFAVVYLLVAGPFIVNHIINPDTGMLDSETTMTAEDLELQKEIIHYRFGGNAFLSSIHISRVKRGTWDTFLLAAVFLLSLFWYKKIKNYLNENQILAYRVSIVFVALIILFILSVETINFIMGSIDRPPVFVEHLRLMRVTGFILIMQFILMIYIFYQKLNKKWLAISLSLILIITPICFFKPVIRTVVRAVVPENIRLKYNLAPIVPEEDVRSFDNLQAISIWTRHNTPRYIKIFVFSSLGHEFKFKVMSRRDTNITGKEGSLWVTSGFANSKQWYLERMRYKEVIGSATDFKDIVELAKELECTHILIPRGEYMDLYDKTKPENLKALYINIDYKLLEID